MTVQDVTELLTENNTLKEVNKNLIAQLDAAKQMFNESSQAVFQLKTNILSLGNKVSELLEEIKTLKAPQAQAEPAVAEAPTPVDVTPEEPAPEAVNA